MRFPLDKMPKPFSSFGWRIHPIEKTRKHHNGVDLAKPISTPIYAIARGTVVYAGASRIKFSNGEPAGGGYIVRIKHKVDGEWITSSYMHLRKGSIRAAGIRVGQKVQEGQKIGEVGNTGESTGPHLHFEIQLGRTYVWSNGGKNYQEPISFIRTKMIADKATAKARKKNA